MDLRESEMAQGHNLKYMAFQKSIIALNNLRYSIDLISDKALRKI